MSEVACTTEVLSFCVPVRGSSRYAEEVPGLASAAFRPFTVTKDFKNASNRESPSLPLFEGVRLPAAEKRLNKEVVPTDPRLSQIVLETVQSNQRTEPSFEKRTPT